MTARGGGAGLACLLVLGSAAAFAGERGIGHFVRQQTNWTVVVTFVLCIGITLWVSRLAASRARLSMDYYAGAGGVTGFQNGLAIAGDYMSAASLLGISGLVFASGFDGLIFSVGWLAGWPVITFLLAERLRNLGKFTFADVAAYRFAQRPVRVFAASGSLIVIVFYLVAQMVGAGQLIKLLLGLEYAYAVILVGIAMLAYVLVGGMTSTTWVQITKAVLLLLGTSVMALGVMLHVGFDLDALFAHAVAAHPAHDAIMGPGGLIRDPWSALSVGVALMFGTAGLPHVLMRFFTVTCAREARRSVAWATGWIGYFYALTFIVGFGAIALLYGNPARHFVGGLPARGLVGGENMAAVHLASVLGGDVFLGFFAAVAFATILAVVAGLALSGASAVARDLYASVWCAGESSSGRELRVAKLTSFALGVVGVALGILCERLNVAVLVMLAFSIACSANFPVLVMAMLWKGCTTRGATLGGFVGLLSSTALSLLSPAVWEGVLRMPAGSAPFPLISPALLTMPLAFLCVWLFSRFDRSPRAAEDRAGYAAQFIRSETGVGLSYRGSR